VPRYLIIGGAPRSGTTSLFRYLSAHPDVCPATRKETYFFARQFDYERRCQALPTAAGFASYFTHCASPDHLRLEATPYTLYTAGAPAHIGAVAPDATLLFILRDPVQRLYSDYRLHRERGKRIASGSFADFIEGQDELGTPTLVDLGLYYRYLRPFREHFEHDRVMVCFFEELTAGPRREVQRLCHTLGLDPSFFDGYRFTVHNDAGALRSARLHRFAMRLEPVVADLRARALAHKRLPGGLGRLLDAAKLLYWTSNRARGSADPPISRNLSDRLRAYYEPDIRSLAAELGREPPWPRGEPADRSAEQGMATVD
jgi:hypothetical protein